MSIKILSNYSDKNKKLTKSGHGIVQWRAGSNQQEIKQSCKGANCLFLKGGAFMNPVNGTVMPGKKIVTMPGTSMADPTYHDKEDRRLIRAIHVEVDLTSRIDATDVAGKEASKLAL